MPSTFSLFKSIDNRRSSTVSSSSSRSAVSKSTAGQPVSAPASTSPQKGPLDLAPSRSASRGKGATPSQSQRTLPALSTKPLTTLEAPDRSASLPSIDLTSPSSDQPRHLWEPDYQDTNHISPHRSSPAPFGSTAHTDLHLSSSDEEQLYRLPSMPRPTSQHGKGKSEPGIGGSSKKGGKAELPDRHDVMRRAMAEATNSDAFGSMSTDSHSEAHPSTAAPSSHVVTSNSSSSVVDHGEGAAADKIGEGRLTFDHFAGTGGDGEVVLADGAAPLPNSAGLPGPSSTAMTTSPSQEGTKVMPSRPKMGSRNNSYQSDSGAAGQAAYTSSPAQSIFNGSAPSSAPLSGTAGKFASSQAGAKVATHGRYATTGHVAEQSRSAKPSLTVPPDYSPGPKQHMHESASTSSLLPSPLHRLRKLSDAGSPSGKSKQSGGIAGALAASGMAGMGVGHAALLQQSQTNLSPSKEKTASMARTPSAGADHRSGYQGGVYRDPKTGEMVERGPETGDDEEHSQRFRYMRDRSATASSHSLAGSDMSAASGLNAAANFSAAAAAQVGLNAGFLGPEDAVRKTNGDAPLLTPSGIGATGGLSPSGMGERVALDEEEAWPGDMGAQITGFAVASSKRNADFHALFSSVPEDDYLIEDYGCALVKEILIQGRLYVSENHVCFYANIFGWVTNIVLPFSEIVSIEKRMTAFVIPNAIQIATLHSKQTFASFLSRDTTYDLIVNIWKLSHPALPTGESALEILTDEESVEHEASPEADHDQRSDAGLEETAPKKSRRKLLKKKLGIKENDQSPMSNGLGAAASEGAAIGRGKSPAPGGKKQAHRKTQCPCEKDKKHYSTVALDTTYPAVPEKIYNLIFTSGFMKEFWTDNQKLMDLQMSDWAPNAQNDNMLSRNMSYIKPLSGGFGPKQTKCVLADENVHVDFDDYVIALTTTRTPDVPSGGSFSVKTRTCFTWAGGNVTRLLVTCQVDWTGRSMVKGIIDRASIDGQKQYYRDLDVAIRKYIKEHVSEFREEGDDEAADRAISGQAETGIEATEAKEGDGAATSQANMGEKEGMAKYLDMASSTGSAIFDALSSLVDGLADMTGGASPSVLILGFVVLLLVASNLWALTSSSSRDPLDPHRLRSNGSGRSSRPPTKQTGYDDHGGSAQAVAVAVREVLRDYFEPTSQAQLMAASRAGTQTPRLSSDDPMEEIQTLLSLLDDVEGRVARLREQIKSASEGQSNVVPASKVA